MIDRTALPTPRLVIPVLAGIALLAVTSVLGIHASTTHSLDAATPDSPVLVTSVG